MAAYCQNCMSTLKGSSVAHCDACGDPRPSAGWPGDPHLSKHIGQNKIEQRLPTKGGYTRYRITHMETGEQRWLWVVPESLCRVKKVSERAQSLLQLELQNVARYKGIGYVENMGLATITEPIPGAPLSELLEDMGVLDTQQALWLGLQLVQGIVAAQCAQIHHGALTPESVWVSTEGVVTISGYELAEASGGVDSGMDLAHLTKASEFLAMEQLAYNKDCQHVDMYQFAAVMFLAWTGESHIALNKGLQIPVSTELGELRRYHKQNKSNPGPRPSRKLSGLKHGELKLDALIGSMLSSASALRPQSMDIVEAMWCQCTEDVEFFE